MSVYYSPSYIPEELNVFDRLAKLEERVKELESLQAPIVLPGSCCAKCQESTSGRCYEHSSFTVTFVPSES